jgi:hypothetical protein
VLVEEPFNHLREVAGYHLALGVDAFLSLGAHRTGGVAHRLDIEVGVVVGIAPELHVARFARSVLQVIHHAQRDRRLPLVLRAARDQHRESSLLGVPDRFLAMRTAALQQAVEAGLGELHAVRQRAFAVLGVIGVSATWQ